MDQIYLTHGSWLYTSLSNSVFSNITQVAWYWLHWEYLYHGNRQTLQTRVFSFSKEPTANHLLAHPWWQRAALSWRPVVFFWPNNDEYEGGRTQALTGYQDIDPWARALCQCSLNWLCFRIRWRLSQSTDVQVRPQSYWIQISGWGTESF